MAKKNADLIGQTAEALLTSIKEQAERQTHPEMLKHLAEAFATVAEHDQNVGSRGGSVIA